MTVSLIRDFDFVYSLVYFEIDKAIKTLTSNNLNNSNKLTLIYETTSNCSRNYSATSRCFFNVLIHNMSRNTFGDFNGALIHDESGLDVLTNKTVDTSVGFKYIIIGNNETFNAKQTGIRGIVVGELNPLLGIIKFVPKVPLNYTGKIVDSVNNKTHLFTNIDRCMSSVDSDLFSAISSIIKQTTIYSSSGLGIEGQRSCYHRSAIECHDTLHIERR